MTHPPARRESGFTLIEILVVIAIIGILVAILGVAVQGVRLRALEEKTIAMLKRIETGCQTYLTRYNALPPITMPPAPQPAVAIAGDPSGRYSIGAGVPYNANSAALHYYLASSLWFFSGFRAGGPTVSKQEIPIVEFQKSEVSSWDQILPGAFGASRYTPDRCVSDNGASRTAGHPLDAWSRSLGYFVYPANNGDMSLALFNRAGSSAGKAGRNLTNFVQLWSRGIDGVSGISPAAPITPAGAANWAAASPADSADDICNFFLPYY